MRNILHSRSRRFFFTLITLLCIFTTYVGYCARKHILFERYLFGRSITFSDFPRAYEDAVRDYFAENKTTLFEYDYPSYPRIDSTIAIPPKIHFIWFKDLYEVRQNGTDIAHEGSNTPDLCREKSPGFEIKIWDAEEARQLIEENYGWFLETYDAYTHPIQRVDAFKYFVLLHHGGVYMDLDVSCRRSLIPLLQYPAWFPKASPLGVNNDLMAARAGHPAVKKMTESLAYRNKNLIFPWLTIFWSTGPRFTTDILKMWVEDTNEKPLNAGDTFSVLPPMFYSEEFTFFGHRPGGSWYGGDVDMVLWLLARPWVAQLLAVVVVFSLLLLVIRRVAPSVRGPSKIWFFKRERLKTEREAAYRDSTDSED